MPWPSWGVMVSRARLMVRSPAVASSVRVGVQAASPPEPHRGGAGTLEGPRSIVGCSRPPPDGSESLGLRGDHLAALGLAVVLAGLGQAVALAGVLAGA